MDQLNTEAHILETYTLLLRSYFKIWLYLRKRTYSKISKEFREYVPSNCSLIPRKSSSIVASQFASGTELGRYNNAPGIPCYKFALIFGRETSDHGNKRLPISAQRGKFLLHLPHYVSSVRAL